MENDFLCAVHLIFEGFITDSRKVNEALMKRFDVQRIVYLPKSLKEKTILKSAVVIFNSAHNLEDLAEPRYQIGGLSMSVVHLSIEDAEDMIDSRKTKLYVGNIPFPVDNLTLWNYFAQYGQLDYSYILKKPVQRGPKGFGFVIYRHRDSARKALSVKNYLEGIKLNCKLFLNKTKIKRLNNQERCPNYHDKCNTEEFYDQSTNSQFSFQNYGLDHSESHFSQESMENPYHSFQLARLELFSSKARFAVSINEDYGNLQHATILIDDELPLVIPNMPIIQVFREADYAVHEPEYFEYLLQMKETQKFKESTLHRQTQLLAIEVPLKDSSTSYDGKSNLVEVGLETSRCNLQPESHPCGCKEVSCNECWCEMIDSRYFSPPCCLCDFKLNPVHCHQFDSFIKDQAAKKDHCLHPPEDVSSPHQPWDHSDADECRPCSKYAQIKKELKKGRCNAEAGYKLFQ